MTNVSTYLFAPLGDLKDLREELLRDCRAWGLKGTILLSPEGINLFVAGEGESVERLLTKLRAVPGLERLTPKISMSDHQPFNRMLVRIKKEIIAFGIEAVQPGRHTSPKLSPRELKRWLDEGRPLTLLDTRNDYEVKLGTFKGAIDPQIRTFREFPEAVRRLPEQLKEAPVVMFCTGGIRCEKAGPFMELEGFKQIYQLDGGILKYFEECGGDHYEGDCFVFDQRVGVDPALSESDHKVCFRCQAPLDRTDQEDPRYVEGVSCPHCHVPEPERMAQRIAQRQALLAQACATLPGAVARETRRPIHVRQKHDRMSLLELLCDQFPQIDAAEWERRCEEGRFVSYAGVVRGKDHIVRAGERVLQVFDPQIEPAVATDIRILHEDEAVLVLNKPAPLPMHPSGRFHRNTLQHFLSLIYPANQVPRLVHRLDANTTGLVVLGRTRHFAGMLQRQFIDGTVAKTYLARVQGWPEADEFRCELPISTEPGATGSRELDFEQGQAALTEFRVLERAADGTALLEARLRSGRTHQIRLHLARLGMPVLGDPTYLSDGLIGDTQTLDIESSPMYLHSWKLSFKHPIQSKMMMFEVSPEWK